MLRFINLISGSGSTNLAILKAEKAGGRLYNLTRTVAIISSNPEAEGIKKAIQAGFPKKEIFVVYPQKGNLAGQLLEIFNRYKPDYFHQLGWMPKTPIEVLRQYRGLNQHMGPGGKGMYGVRRVYAFQLFCQRIGEQRPFPVFCQWVAPEYDAGKTIYLKEEKVKPEEDPEEVAERLLEVEHEVQIEGRYHLAKNDFKERPVPQIAKNEKEKEILSWAIKQAIKAYP